MQIVLGVIAGLILLDGLLPSVRYIYAKTKNPFLIRHYAQHEVAVSRFLKHVVAGEEHPGSPRLERDEFNRIQGSLNPSYETLICSREVYSIIHLFLHDYDDAKVLSFCGGSPFFVMSEQDVWDANKRAILTHAPGPKDLKLIWERDPKTERIITMFQTARDLGSEDSLSFSFGGIMRRFYVLNISNKNIREFQDRVAGFPATPDLKSLAKGPATMFDGGKGRGKEPGRGPDDLHAMVAAHRDEARACYDKGLADHPGMEGNLVIAWLIDPKGKVSHVELDPTRSQITDPTLRLTISSLPSGSTMWTWDSGNDSSGSNCKAIRSGRIPMVTVDPSGSFAIR